MKISTSLDSPEGKKQNKETKKPQNFPQGRLFFSKDLFLKIRPVYFWGE